MRDPNRIPKMLELVKRYWEKYPDLRLCQLIHNAVSVSDERLLHNTDHYYIEDDLLEKGLRKLLASLGE